MGRESASRESLVPIDLTVTLTPSWVALWQNGHSAIIRAACTTARRRVRSDRLPTQRGSPLTAAPRIGIGHDTHRLGEGGPLRLAGLQIDHDRHLIGHSDADVLLHAVTDALLGALSLGDIGELFPDTEAENRDRDSKEFLDAALQRVKSAGFGIGNLDCIVHAQRPKLSPYKHELRRRLAGMLGIPATAVSVKAKTGELVGPVGREEAITAHCVVMLLPEASVPE